MTTDILSLIGKTPVLELKKVNDTGAKILVKLETLNPSGSIKDIMALYMTEVAEKNGLLQPGGKIIEATSGNTGISFAMVAAIKGYKFVAVMPQHMSKERRQLMEAFGAEIVLTPEETITGSLQKLEELAAASPDAWLPKQFQNPDNTAAHREITAKRILEEVDGSIDAFVAGVGTGGTLMGVSQALRKAYPKVKTIAVEPAESAVMSGGNPGLHLIQGIGPGYIPEIVKVEFIDQVIAVKGSDAVNMARKLVREEGLMVGPSSGANVLASLQVAREMGKGKTIVTILPDRGERYLSMDVF